MNLWRTLWLDQFMEGEIKKKIVGYYWCFHYFTILALQKKNIFVPKPHCFIIYSKRWPIFFDHLWEKILFSEYVRVFEALFVFSRNLGHNSRRGSISRIIFLLSTLKQTFLFARLDSFKLASSLPLSLLKSLLKTILTIKAILAILNITSSLKCKIYVAHVSLRAASAAGPGL